MSDLRAIKKKWKAHFSLACNILSSSGLSTGRWSFGGGTALMLYYSHRFSKDIDIFLNDAQLLSSLSPRLNPSLESRSDIREYDEQSNFVKIRFADDFSIDFILAPELTKNSVRAYCYHGSLIKIEKPIEIILKKLFYRSATFTARDIFDLAVFASKSSHDRDVVRSILGEKIPMLRGRLEQMRKYYEAELKTYTIFYPEHFVRDSLEISCRYLHELSQNTPDAHPAIS